MKYHKAPLPWLLPFFFFIAVLSGCAGQSFKVNNPEDAFALGYTEIEGLAVLVRENCCTDTDPTALITRERSREMKELLRESYSALATARFIWMDSGTFDEGAVERSARIAGQVADLLAQQGVEE